MKKFIALLLAFCLIAPAALAEELPEAELRVVAMCDAESVEVGDQFLVRIMLDGDFDKYMTYSVCGSFDFEAAELVAPVYKDDGFSIVYNDFNNETGAFRFDAADIAHASGVGDPLVCSLLFRAKRAGGFGLRLGEAGGTGDSLYLGRSVPLGDKLDYDVAAEGLTLEITEDTDDSEVTIISGRSTNTPYDDMYDHRWAELAVGAMARIGVLDGIAEGSFYPDKSVTRGEFTAMLVRGAKLAGEGEGFADVPSDYPFAKEITAARALGIAFGDENGNFYPDRTVSRQDVSALVYRAMTKLNKIRPADESVLDAFPDGGDVSEYAREAFAACAYSNLLKGDEDGFLDPLDDMTRAEAAVLMESVIIHIKLVNLS